MSKVGSFLMILFLFSSVVFQGTGVMAEEILVTNDGIHLGWVISKGRFMTCHKIIMEIGGGSVEGIEDGCPTFWKIPSMSGLVDAIDASGQILSIRDEEGQIHTLFYFETTEGYGRTQLKDLEKGDRVFLTVPVPGRVGSIQTEKK